VLKASLRVRLRHFATESTVVGFPSRENQFSVCMHLPELVSYQAVVGIHGRL
jgi:hypothetical protein